MKDNFYINKYGELLLDYSLWEKKSDYLYESAKLLESKIENDWRQSQNGSKPFDYHYSSIYLMLSSFAIENLLKAIIIKNDLNTIKTNFKKCNRLPKILSSHNLLELARKANSNDIDKEENIFLKIFLKKLSRNAIWEGRYPIPKNPKDNSQEGMPFFNTFDFDDKLITDLIKELKHILNKKTK